MKTNKKTIWIVFIVVLVVALGYVGWRYIHKTEIIPAATMLTYMSDSDGVTFQYPNSYALEEHPLDIDSFKGKYLNLLPKNASVPVAGEGPTGLAVEILENSSNLPLHAWVEKVTNGSSVIATSTDSAVTLVGGEGSVFYRATGLYESDNVAVAHGKKVYVFSASWMTRNDQTLKDLQTVLQTVHFTN